MDTRTAGRMGGKIGGRSRSPRKRKAVLANLAKANAALAAKRRRRSYEAAAYECVAEWVCTVL